jgi:26S proteasome regulatory subunit N1
MLHHCTDHAQKPDEKEEEKPEGAAAATAEATTVAGEEKEKVEQDMTYQAFAVIGIALIAMGEEVGAAMCLRQFNHLVSPIPCEPRACVNRNADLDGVW